MEFAQNVQIKEVGPRDGLQNEDLFISTDKKIDWLNRLSKTGLNYIEVTSFVSPKWIPQLRDGLELVTSIDRVDGVTYAALVPNEKGLERAIEAKIDEVSVFLSASESHNLINLNKSIETTIPILESVVKEAIKEGKKVRGYISTAFGCPYEGRVSTEKVKKLMDRLLTMGVYEVSLGDTIGIAHPKQMDDFLTDVLKEFPSNQLALHLHDTRGLALANSLVGLSKGITVFDSSIAGLGGCPYAKGASGNLATEDLIYMLEQMGFETGVDFNKLMGSALYIQAILGKSLYSKQLKILSSE